MKIGKFVLIVCIGWFGILVGDGGKLSAQWNPSEIRDEIRDKVVYLKAYGSLRFSNLPVTAQKTGVTVSGDGYVLTSYQLISGLGDVLPESLRIEAQAGDQYHRRLPARIVNKSEYTGLLLLKLPWSDDPYPAVSLGSATDLDPDSTIFTFGFFGEPEWEHKFQYGRVIDRSLSSDLYWNTDFEFTLGLNGSPVFNEAGEVVGIINQNEENQNNRLELLGGYTRFVAVDSAGTILAPVWYPKFLESSKAPDIKKPDGAVDENLSSKTVDDSGDTKKRGAFPLSVPAEMHESGFNPAESAGIFIGVREFEFSELVEVPYAVDDAIDLAHLFSVQLKLIDPSKVFLALSGEPQNPTSKEYLKELIKSGAKRREATKSWLINLISTQAANTGAGGLFIVTFATHGYSDAGSQYLAASDSLSASLTSTSISAGTLFNYVFQSNADRRIVLLDACREQMWLGRSIEDPASAMSKHFYDAISDAEGQVILQATTTGGYAYDDPDLKNGVFTASIIDGLTGEAQPNNQGLITAENLANYVQERVVSWIKLNRSHHAKLSKGISTTFEGLAATMPLSVNVKQFKENESYVARVEAALTKLADTIRSPNTQISGENFDLIKSILFEDRSQATLDLLQYIEELDGDIFREKSLLRFLKELDSDIESQLISNDQISSKTDAETEIIISSPPEYSIEPKKAPNLKKDPGEPFITNLVNLSARENCVSEIEYDEQLWTKNSVKLSLQQGKYRIQPSGEARAISTWENDQIALGQGKNPWKWYIDIVRKGTKNVERIGSSGQKFLNKEDAFNNALVKTLVFNLDKKTEVLFGIGDDVCSDNRGGVTFELFLEVD